MQVIKVLGKVYGAKLTNAEREALTIEVNKQLAEMTRKHEIEIDSLVLWVLMEQFGFGEKRLHQYYTGFGPAIKALIERYELEDTDDVWLCTKKLQDKGIDIEAWRKEIGLCT